LYVCICNGITEEMLEQANKHSTSQKEVLKKLGVGNSCGICVIDALEKMNQVSQTKNKNINFGNIDQTK